MVILNKKHKEQVLSLEIKLDLRVTQDRSVTYRDLDGVITSRSRGEDPKVEVSLSHSGTKLGNYHEGAARKKAKMDEVTHLLKNLELVITNAVSDLLFQEGPVVSRFKGIRESGGFIAKQDTTQRDGVIKELLKRNEERLRTRLKPYVVYNGVDEFTAPFHRDTFDFLNALIDAVDSFLDNGQKVVKGDRKEGEGIATKAAGSIGAFNNKLRSCRLKWRDDVLAVALADGWREKPRHEKWAIFLDRIATNCEKEQEQNISNK